MIIEYTNTREDGSLKDTSVAHCCCDWCGEKWQTKYGAIRISKSQGSICQWCSRRGSPPITPEDFIAQNPVVAAVLSGLTKQGFIGSGTRVLCKCESCFRKWEIDVQDLRRSSYFGESNAICATCLQWGTPIFPDEAISKYEEIVAVKNETLNARGGVGESTIVVAVCRTCGEKKEISYPMIDRVEGWECKECHDFSRGFQIFPEDNNCIIDYYSNTLTAVGALGRSTKILIACPSCNDKRWTTWGRYNDGYVKCHPCAVTEALNRPETKKKLLESLARQGGMSQEHKSFKAYLEQSGVYGFESEQLIGEKRVDELRDNLIVFYHGTYWHADERMYNEDEVIYQDVTASEIWERDMRTNMYLSDLGYSIYEVWALDFEKNPDQVINNIKQWIKENS